MANPIVMPRLGDFMTEGTISKWHRSSGDTIKQGEVIAEIEKMQQDAKDLNYKGFRLPVVAQKYYDNYNLFH